MAHGLSLLHNGLFQFFRTGVCQISHFDVVMRDCGKNTLLSLFSKHNPEHRMAFNEFIEAAFQSDNINISNRLNVIVFSHST